MPSFAARRIPPALEDVAPTLAVFTTLVHAPVSVDGDVCAPPGGPRRSPYADPGLERCLLAVEAATPLGTTAREELGSRLRGMAAWVDEHHDSELGPLERFALPQFHRVRHDFIREYRSFRLWLELHDERQRAAALADKDKRKAYLLLWRGLIKALLRGPSWYVPGLSAEDVAGELLLALIGAVDSGESAPFVAGGTPGIEGTFTFLVREKNRMRRRRRIYAVVHRDAAIVSALHERTPSGEDLVSAKEQRVEAQSVIDRAGEHLSPKRRRYYAEVLSDVRKHGYLSEVRVAKVLGVHKASVSRALKAILGTLRKVGATPFIEGKPRARRAFRRLWKAVQDRPRGMCMVGLAGGPLRGPQPPWLDEGDAVRIIATGEYGVVVAADRYMTGTVYRVRCGTRPIVELERECLDYQGNGLAVHAVRF